MSRSLFAPCAGELYPLLSSAWARHRTGHFTEADRLFAQAVSQDDTPESRVEWGKSLRYRGQIEQALEHLHFAWELGKSQGCLRIQQSVCLQLATCHREQGSNALWNQFLQLALSAYRDSVACGAAPMPEELLLETCFSVADAEQALWVTHQLERLFTYSQDDFIKASAAEALSCFAWNSGRREKSLQFTKQSCLHFCRAGHISAALRISEIEAERLLATKRWSEGLATLAVAQRHAELLGLRTRVASHQKQRGQLKRALGLLNQQHLHN